jgi:HK97 family phage major capsid protein
MSKLQKMQDELIEVRDRALALAEQEELTADEDVELRAAEARFDELAAQVKAEEARAARIETMKGTTVTRHAPNVIPSAPERPSMRGFVPAGELRDFAQRALEARAKTGELSADSASKVERILAADTPDARIARHITATGSDEYRNAFGKLLAGRQFSLTESERDAVEEVRAASLTDAAGGFAVPFNLDPTLILTNSGTTNPVRALARVVQVTGDNWNGVATAGVTASWDGEAGTVSDDAPTLAQPSITVHKAQAFVPFSIEVGMDWANMSSDVAALFVDAKDRLEGTAFISGSGTNQPWGVVAACEANTATTQVDSTTASAFGVEDIYKLLNAVPVRFRTGPKVAWLAEMQILNRIRQFGTSNNYHGYTVDLTADGIPQLVGRPIYEASAMTGTITSVSNILLAGDFNNYVIADRIGMSVELVPHLFDVTNNRPTGQRGFFAWWRVGADSVNDSAFRLLQT